MTQTPANPQPAAPAPGEFVADVREQVPHHESARKARQAAPRKMELNLTAMIDVIFQLLIYFVITANFTPGEGIITATLPKFGISETAATIKKPPQKLVIVVASEGTYEYSLRIDGISDSPRDFIALARLLERLQWNPEMNRKGVYDHKETPVQIKPEPETRWQHVVNAFNAAVKARYKNIAFAAPSQSSER